MCHKLVNIFTAFIPNFFDNSLISQIRYHRQFKVAAKERYFKTDADYLYFHSMMSDFFLGKYGGGIPKAFRYTEIQKHRFNLKSKDSEADRQVPAMPLVYYTKDGRINRYINS